LKRPISTIISVLILLCTLTSIFNLQPLQAAQPGATIYIKADGSIDPPSAPIKRNNNIYTLTDNINIDLGSIVVEGRVNWCGIIVQKSDITIDGGGYNLTGEEVWRSGNWRGVYVGIWLSGLSNIAVKNVEVVNFFDGIYLGSASNIDVSGNTVSNNKRGISLELSSNNKICKNKMEQNRIGICLYQSSTNTISENEVSNSLDSGEAEFSGIVGPSLNLPVSCIAFTLSKENEINGNKMMAKNGDAILISSNSNDNRFTENTVNESQIGIAFEHASSNNVLVRNNITKNNCGVKIFPIEVSHPYPSSNNKFYHNNFIDNANQVEINPNTSVNSWDGGYPTGGNYWDNWRTDDALTGKNQDQPGGDGIDDKSYIIDNNNIDHYPLRHLVSSSEIRITSITYTIPVDATEYQYTDTGGTPGAGMYTFRDWVIVVPKLLKVKIEINGAIVPFAENLRVEYHRAGQPIASYTLTDASFKLNFEIGLSHGVYEDSIELYSANNLISSKALKVLSYTWSGFKVTEDGYGFENYRLDFKTFVDTIKGFFNFWKVKSNCALIAAIPLLYPLVSLQGHCYGMSLSSILFYTDQLSPPSTPVYEIKRADVQSIIAKYHVKQLIDIPSEAVADLLLDKSIATSIDKEFEKAKNLINNEVPAILHYDKHAVTIVGYVEAEGEKYWIINDSEFPGKLVVFEISDKGINVWSTNFGEHTDAEVYTPVPWTEDAPDLLVDAVKSILGELARNGKRVMGFGSPVDVNVLDAEGNKLSIINEEITKNDIQGASAYTRDGVKSILLPWDKQFSVELSATDAGEATIGDISLGEVTLFEDILLNGSEIIHAVLEPGKPTLELSVDSDGDGEIDFKLNPTNSETFPAPTPMPPTPTSTPTPTFTPNPPPTFDTSIIIYAVAIICIGIIIAALFVIKKRRKTLPPPPPPPPV
jgi:parallel beta-helix repeat protein